MCCFVVKFDLVGLVVVFGYGLMVVLVIALYLYAPKLLRFVVGCWFVWFVVVCLVCVCFGLDGFGGCVGLFVVVGFDGSSLRCCFCVLFVVV